MNPDELKKEALDLIEHSDAGITSGYLADRMSCSFDEAMCVILELAEDKVITRDSMNRWKIPRAAISYGAGSNENRINVERQILNLMRGRGVIRRKVIHHGMSRYSMATVDKAMCVLKEKGAIVKISRGSWCLRGEQPNA